MQPTPALLPGESPWQRSLAGYSSWCSKESDRTERPSAHTHSYCQYYIEMTINNLNIYVYICVRVYMYPHMHKCIRRKERTTHKRFQKSFLKKH